ncbi:MAG: DUF3179 domain-containing protein [Burkholderiales bacterium]|nr:DUF3179 domain-containing protein [Phycisphaerae bacterium]
MGERMVVAVAAHFTPEELTITLAGVRVAIPLLLVACLAAGWLAYGTSPPVADWVTGLSTITLTRRLQWILMIAAIGPCLALVVRVAMGLNRAWWLLGLSLVVGLLFVRFSPETMKPVRVLEGPSLLTVEEAGLATDVEFVVGVVWGDSAYAFPYRSLLRTPIVQITDFDRRLLLIHSPYANSATALEVGREIRAVDLEFVGSPGNSTLVYNRKYGQFIVGITGLTDDGKTPIGVRGQVATERMSFADWRQLHPKSRLMLPSKQDAAWPGVAAHPQFAPKLTESSLPAETQIILIHTHPRAAMLMTTDFAEPVHVKAGAMPLVLWRANGRLKAFDRKIDHDLFLTFRHRMDKSRQLKLMDNQTGSTWSYAGICTVGQLAGKRLTTVRLEEGVYWGVSREWFPDTQLIRTNGNGPEQK